MADSPAPRRSPRLMNKVEPAPAKLRKPRKPKPTKNEVVNSVREAEYQRALAQYNQANDARKPAMQKRKRQITAAWKGAQKQLSEASSSAAAAACAASC